MAAIIICVIAYNVNQLLSSLAVSPLSFSLRRFWLRPRASICRHVLPDRLLSRDPVAANLGSPDHAVADQQPQMALRQPTEFGGLGEGNQTLSGGLASIIARVAWHNWSLQCVSGLHNATRLGQKQAALYNSQQADVFLTHREDAMKRITRIAIILLLVGTGSAACTPETTSVSPTATPTVAATETPTPTLVATTVPEYTGQGRGGPVDPDTLTEAERERYDEALDWAERYLLALRDRGVEGITSVAYDVCSFTTPEGERKVKSGISCKSSGVRVVMRRPLQAGIYRWVQIVPPGHQS
jgi:hypothetical protein